MKPERIQHLRTLCENATPGPWKEWMGDMMQLTDAGKGYPLNHYPDSATIWGRDGDDVIFPSEANATFIAEARTALPEALDYIEELERAVEYHVNTGREVTQLLVDETNQLKARITELESAAQEAAQLLGKEVARTQELEAQAEQNRGAANFAIGALTQISNMLLERGSTLYPVVIGLLDKLNALARSVPKEGE